MDTALRHRRQLLPECIRKSRALAFTELMKAGCSRELVEREIDHALAWANSQVLTHKQEKYRRKRAALKEQIKGDDALDAMFRAAGADPAEIPTRKGFDQQIDWQAAGLMAAFLKRWRSQHGSRFIY